MLPTYVAQYYNRPMMDGGDWGWGFLMMLFWAVVIILIVVLIVRGFGSNHADSSKSDALDIAKERYAKGEIKKEEFEQLKKDLK